MTGDSSSRVCAQIRVREAIASCRSLIAASPRPQHAVERQRPDVVGLDTIAFRALPYSLSVPEEAHSGEKIAAEAVPENPPLHGYPP